MEFFLFFYTKKEFFLSFLNLFLIFVKKNPLKSINIKKEEKNN